MIINNITQAFDLPCYDNRKTFYGKAKVIETAEGRYLKSYDTIICFLSYGGTFVRIWGGFSATTMRHVNSFMNHVRLGQYGGKKWWDGLEVNRKYDITSGDMIPV